MNKYTLFRTRWYKVISDLWDNRMRTFMVALAVAVGIYAVGGLLAIQTLLLREYRRDRDEARIPSAILNTDPFDAEFVNRIRQVPGVSAVTGQGSISARVLLGPGEWQDILLIAVEDFQSLDVSRYPYVAGSWPAEDGEMMLEHLGLPYLQAAIGDRLTLEFSDGRQKELRISGTAHYPQQPSPQIIGTTFGLITVDTMMAMGFSPYFTEMHILVQDGDGEGVETAVIRRRISAVEEQFENSGRRVYSSTIVGESLIESIINTVILILTFFGWLILLLSGFLVINTISALIAQQVQQIGILKLIGASRMQMIGLYITMVLVYGLVAFIISIPLAVWTAQSLMKNLVEGLINVRADSYAIPWWVYLVMVAVGLLIPLLAGLLPVWRGTKITTFQALQEGGRGGEGAGGEGFVQRLLNRLPTFELQRPFLLAFRNTLRHKTRLVRTLLILILGTALFIAVVSVRVSVSATQADFLRYHQYDVRVSFARPYRIHALEQLAADFPEFAHVESWGRSSAVRLRPGGEESNRYTVYGVPMPTTQIDPVIQDGRWLQGDDDYAVVINATVFDEEQDVIVGDKITLEINDSEKEWTVVGIVGADAQGANIFMNYDTFAYETRLIGRANILQLGNQSLTAADQERLENHLFSHFDNHGFAVTGTQTARSINAENELMFNLIVVFLLLMAVLLAAVGSLGLSTTMGINVLERIREIGVLRAIGASNGAIRRIVLFEGLTIGILSWILGFFLSFPITRFMNAQIGQALLSMPLTHTYAGWSAALWFVALLALAVAASLGPARQAVKLTIREVLAYE